MIQVELMTHVPEKVLLTPPRKHPLSYFCNLNILPGCHHRGLVTTVTKASNLTHPELLTKKYGSLTQPVGNLFT